MQIGDASVTSVRVCGGVHSKRTRDRLVALTERLTSAWAAKDISVWDTKDASVCEARDAREESDSWGRTERPGVSGGRLS